MMLTTRTASSTLALAVIGVSLVSGQAMLTEVMARYGVLPSGGSFERAFDDGMAPSSPVAPGSLATPLGLMTSTTGHDRNTAAFAFGILAGRGGRAASLEELVAAGHALVQMVGDPDRRARIAGARVAGRVFAVPFDARTAINIPPGLTDGLFTLFNRDTEIEQLAAMDALGLTRTTSAVSSLTDRYHFYRSSGKRALAGGALEALARIGDPSSSEICKGLVTDTWSAGRDATALAVLFARERILKDGSVAGIRQALDDRSRRAQAMGYLAELGVSAP